MEEKRETETYNIELVNIFFSNGGRKRDSNESAYYYWVGLDAGVCVVCLRDPRI